MTRLTPVALAAEVVRIERTAADNGKRALIVALSGTDWHAMKQLAAQLGIAKVTLIRAISVVRHAPEMVPRVLSGAVKLTTAYRLSSSARIRTAPVVARLPSAEEVRIDVRWVSAEISRRLGAALDMICELPRPEDVAALGLNGLEARVTRAATWLTQLAEAIKESK
jgi:hypothetical protein